MDKITEHLRGRSNAGLRRIVRDAAHEPNRGIGYDSAEAIADRIGRRVALTPSGRASVLAALRALERDCYRVRGQPLVCSHCDAPATTVGGRLAVPMCATHALIANEAAAHEDEEHDAIAEAAERRAEARRLP